ncbi:hypothetical protein ACFUC1_19665 [Pedococcus sp. NPDC057267]|uniref:WapI family immunity protein n=1 Tax=Pedococcus sp. NPDC057267 TaxID=3346077 RepID=UPI003628B568
MTAEFRMGSTDGEHLSITVLGREHPDAENYWDRNWVISTISVAIGGFTGHVRASLRTDEVHRFNKELKSVNQNLFGAAVLDSMEHWITLTVKAESRGRIQVTGELRDRVGDGNVLTFEMAEVDQTYLGSWITSLDDIEEAFPVIGKP